MEKPSRMMAGATMRVEADALRAMALGSLIHIEGRVPGADLLVDDVVTERMPPFRKTWQTLGQPQLLVVGAYRMGFTVTPAAHRARLVVFIDYQLPPRGIGHVSGLLLGRASAMWRTRRMVADAVTAMAGAARAAG